MSIFNAHLLQALITKESSYICRHMLSIDMIIVWTINDKEIEYENMYRILSLVEMRDHLANIIIFRQYWWNMQYNGHYQRHWMVENMITRRWFEYKDIIQHYVKHDDTLPFLNGITEKKRLISCLTQVLLHHREVSYMYNPPIFPYMNNSR